VLGVRQAGRILEARVLQPEALCLAVHQLCKSFFAAGDASASAMHASLPDWMMTP